MSVTNDQQNMLTSIKVIYEVASIPVLFCNKNVVVLWKNKKAEEIFKNVNIDLMLSKKDNIEIKNAINNNENIIINACFLPFLGCRIHVLPLIYNEFKGAILNFDIYDNSNDNYGFDKTDNIVSILSSNLRLPMHFITNAVEILNYDLERFPENVKEKVKKSITVVESNTYKMFRICKNLSELIRFSTNSNPINKSTVKISDYVNKLIDDCSEYIYMTGLNLVYNFSNDNRAPTWMTIDCEKFDLAISNIILNSCQYSMKNTNIKIDIHTSLKELNIVIEDEGFGISSDNISDVFRPYTTFENKQYVSKGLGIGLTLVKYIINQHDGDIFIESEEDIGTKVTIILPINTSNKDNVIRVNNRIEFSNKMSTIAIQFSPLLY